jgi:NADPH-dependent F420 reductase
MFPAQPELWPFFAPDAMAKRRQSGQADRMVAGGSVGIIGGTGPAGSGLAVRFAAAGHSVLLGSRDVEKATNVAKDLTERWGTRVAGLQGVTNEEAAEADIVVIATVADSAVATATGLAPALAGRVVVSMANLLERGPRGFAAVLPEHGSVAEAVQRAVPSARVVGAYQSLPAKALAALDEAIDADVVVCGDDAAAVEAVVALTATVDGLHPLDGGPLVNAVGVEALTAVLLTVNRARKAEHGIRIVALRRPH